MSFGTNTYTPVTSLVGTLVFPGRQSVLPASTVPEYPAQAYPVLNFSSAANEMNLALGDGGYPMSNSSSYGMSFPSLSSYMGYNTTSNSSTNSNNILSMFDPLPISDYYGNQIPTTNCVVQGGLFGNFYGLQSILSRFVGDTMPTDKDAPGYTWKYTVPSFGSTSTASTSTTTSTTSTTTSSSKSTSSTSSINDVLSMFDPLPISDYYGNQIPTTNCVVQEGLFGNFYGVQSILSRYVGDTMSTDKDSPGYTWKYTVPGA